MPGIRITTASAVAIFALFSSPGAAHAQTDLMPLQVGNQWVYRSTGPGAAITWKVSVTRTENKGGQDYAVVEGFPETETLLLRAAADGTVYSYQDGGERIWVKFPAAIKEEWPTTVNACNAAGVIESKAARYRGPIGQFDNAVQVRYTYGGCADAGLDGDIFLPWIGLVRRSSQTIAGPRHFDLIYARIADTTVVSEGDVSFTLTLDKAVYYANLMPPVDPARAVPVMTARLTLRNTTDQEIEIEFPSGQKYEIQIKNERGETVYTWSADKAFIQVFETLKLSKGELNWVETIRLSAAEEGKPLAAGRYIAEAWLTTNGGQKRFASSVGFRVEHAF